MSEDNDICAKAIAQGWFDGDYTQEQAALVAEQHAIDPNRINEIFNHLSAEAEQ